MSDRAHAARQRLIEYGTGPALLTAGPSASVGTAGYGSQQCPSAACPSQSQGQAGSRRPPLSERLKLRTADDNAQVGPCCSVRACAALWHRLYPPSR